MSFISGFLGAKAAKAAANIQATSINRATDVQERMQLRSLSLLEPYRQAGVMALRSYLPLILGTQNVTRMRDAQQAEVDRLTKQSEAGPLDAESEFQLSQANTRLYELNETVAAAPQAGDALNLPGREAIARTVDRGLSARGLYNSGAGIEELTKTLLPYSLSRLENLISLGSGQGTAGAQIVQGSGNAVSNLAVQGGQAAAGGILGSAQAYQGIGGGAGLVGGLYALNNPQWFKFGGGSGAVAAPISAVSNPTTTSMGISSSSLGSFDSPSAFGLIGAA